MRKISDIILDEHAVALNDLLLACHRSANHFSRAVNLLENESGMATRLDAIRRRRQEQCDGIRSIMSEMNYLPKEPDPDREMVTDLALRAKTLLSEDGKNTLLQKAAQMETELEKQLKGALKLIWSEQVKEKLDHIGESLQEDKGRIDELIESHLRKGEI